MLTRNEVTAWSNDEIDRWLAGVIGLRLVELAQDDWEWWDPYARCYRAAPCFTHDFNALFATQERDRLEGPLEWLSIHHGERELGTYLDVLIEEWSARGPRDLAVACVIAINAVKEKWQRWYQWHETNETKVP